MIPDAIADRSISDLLADLGYSHEMVSDRACIGQRVRNAAGEVVGVWSADVAVQFIDAFWENAKRSG